MASPTLNVPQRNVSRFSVTTASSRVASSHGGSSRTRGGIEEEEEDHDGEYGAAQRASNHIYYGIDGRPLAPKDDVLQQAPDWKPFSLKWPFVTALFLALLGLLAATEYAIRKLPAQTDRSEVPTAAAAMAAPESTQTTASADQPLVPRRVFVVVRRTEDQQEEGTGQTTNGTKPEVKAHPPAPAPPAAELTTTTTSQAATLAAEVGKLHHGDKVNANNNDIIPPTDAFYAGPGAALTISSTSTKIGGANAGNSPKATPPALETDLLGDVNVGVGLTIGDGKDQPTPKVTPSTTKTTPTTPPSTTKTTATPPKQEEQEQQQSTTSSSSTSDRPRPGPPQAGNPQDGAEQYTPTTTTATTKTGTGGNGPKPPGVGPDKTSSSVTTSSSPPAQSPKPSPGQNPPNNNDNGQQNNGGQENNQGGNNNNQGGGNNNNQGQNNGQQENQNPSWPWFPAPGPAPQPSPSPSPTPSPTPIVVVPNPNNGAQQPGQNEGNQQEQNNNNGQNNNGGANNGNGNQNSGNDGNNWPFLPGITPWLPGGENSNGNNNNNQNGQDGQSGQNGNSGNQNGQNGQNGNNGNNWPFLPGITPPLPTGGNSNGNNNNNQNGQNGQTGNGNGNGNGNGSGNENNSPTPPPTTPQPVVSAPTSYSNVVVPPVVIVPGKEDVDVPEVKPPQAAAASTTTTRKTESPSIVGQSFTTAVIITRITTIDVPTEIYLPTTVSGRATSQPVSTTLRGQVQTISTTSSVDGVLAAPTVVYITATTITITVTVEPTSTTTSVITPSPIWATLAYYLRDDHGKATSTIVETVTLKPRTVTLTNAHGIPTKVVTQYAALPSTTTANSTPDPTSSTSAQEIKENVYNLSHAEYFIGFFLPALLGVLLLVPVRLLETSVRQLQPFHRLAASRGGADARDSICLRTGLINSIPAAFRSLVPATPWFPAASSPYSLPWWERGWLGDPPVMFLSKGLLASATLLLPLLPEAVGLKLHGNCRANSFSGCYLELAVFPEFARAAMALIAFMALLALLILLALMCWRSGVASSPWSVAGITSFATNPAFRSLLRTLPPMGVGKRSRRVTHARLLRAAGARKFRMACWPVAMNDETGMVLMDYGVVICSEAGRPLNEEALALGEPILKSKETDIDDEEEEEVSAKLQAGDVDSLASAKSWWLRRMGLVRQPRGSFAALGGGSAGIAARKEHHLPFMMLSHAPRLLFIALGCGLLALILYYKHTTGDNGFENFMSTQSLGVRVLFTLLGVGIAFFMSSFFTNIAIISPYLMLSSEPRDAWSSVLMPAPTNAFAGLYTALRRRHWFLASTAFVACLAEFMPILLNNVPYRPTMTVVISDVCTYGSVAILVLSIAIVIGSFFVAWPHLPVDPSSIAGAMFYVCDSYLLSSTFAGTSLMGEGARDGAVEALRLRYEFGVIEGGTDCGQRIGFEVAREAAAEAAAAASEGMEGRAVYG